MTETTPDIVLYDLASVKGTCFSPSVWRIRLMLSYKQIPYKTIFVEFPDIEPTLKELGIPPAESGPKYTVPAIHHIPSNKHIMGSSEIAEFIESIHPAKPIQLKSDLGTKIELDARTAAAHPFRYSVTPREKNILSPRAAEYFQRTREAALGMSLDSMLEADEEANWSAAHEALRAVSELMLTNSADGPFILGAQPSVSDFSITGILQCAREVHEEVWERLVAYPGFAGIYEACGPYMDRRD